MISAEWARKFSAAQERVRRRTTSFDHPREAPHDEASTRLEEGIDEDAADEDGAAADGAIDADALPQPPAAGDGGDSGSNTCRSHPSGSPWTPTRPKKASPSARYDTENVGWLGMSFEEKCKHVHFKPIQVYEAHVLEFVERPPPAPNVACCERFIDGHDEYGAGYTKHNTNAGSGALSRRLTPQVFSAYTFFASSGELLVCDIQGVGDLYTDPQIHTRALSGGEGDLGARGMALFFASYDEVSRDESR